MVMDTEIRMNTREALLAWMDQFENDHYIFDAYGETVAVDLPRETVEKVMDISLLLVDRVVEAKGELATTEYEDLEKRFRKDYPEKDFLWLFNKMPKEYFDEHLFGRFRDIEAMIGDLMPGGYSRASTPYYMLIRPEINKLIYAVIRHVDNAEKNYESLAYTFFTGVLAKGWAQEL